jgi:hypothetical protein
MAALVAAFVVMLATAAQADVCMRHADMKSWLAAEFQESRVGRGPAGDRGLMLYELYLSAGGETWTIVRTRTDGMSCIAAAGDGWEISPLRQGDPS